MSQHHELADLLHSIGWAAPNDAQHTNLRDAMPRIATLLFPDHQQHLRDEFAGRAMQELLSQDGMRDEVVASSAYRIADLMLKERMR